MSETVSFGGEVQWRGGYWIIWGLARHAFANTAKDSVWQLMFCHDGCLASSSIKYWEFDSVSTEEYQTLRTLLDQLVDHPEIACPNWQPEWKPDAVREFSAIRERVVQRIAQLTEAHE